MKKMIVIAVIFLVIGVGAYLCIKCSRHVCDPGITNASEKKLVVDSSRKEECGESCSVACQSDQEKSFSKESNVCGGCDENSCSVSCSSNPANDSGDLKSLLPSCNLSNEDLYHRKDDLRKSIFSKIHSVQEMENGYDLIFKQPKEYSVELLEFINFERTCCSSFTYALIFEPNNQATHLQIYGSQEFKEEIKSGFAGLGVQLKN